MSSGSARRSERSWRPDPVESVVPRVVPILCAVMIAGCAGRVPKPLPTAPETPRPARVTPSVPVLAESAARARVAQAAAMVEQTRMLVPVWDAAEPHLRLARSALLVRAWDVAGGHADEAMAAAESTLSDFYTRRANAELARAQTYTGLDDEHLSRLLAAEEILSTGNSRLAYGELRRLNAWLDSRIQTHAVRSGDSLWSIASQARHYANPWLWPLIWRANLAVLPDPDRLRSGQVLRVQRHPTVDEVADALLLSRRRAGLEPLDGGSTGVVPEIGEIERLPGP